MRYRSALAAAAVAIVATVTAGVVVFAAGPGAAGGAPRWVGAPAGSPSPSPVVSPSVASPTATATSAAAPSPSCAAGTGWDCAQQRRFAAARAYLEQRPGKLAVIVADRGTGTVWRAGTTTNTTWTASTIKIAIAAAVLERQRAGQATLTATDRDNLHAALVASSNDAATALWNRHGPQSLFDRFRTVYGMTTLSVVPGYELFWRHLRCSAEDLQQLMSYVLTRLHADDRAYLVQELRGVNANQHWGVWAAGSALRPGNKDGWAQKPDTGGTHWVTHSVGFAGPSERYIVVVTYSLLPSGTLAEGARVVSDLVATIFGAPVPAQISTP